MNQQRPRRPPRDEPDPRLWRTELLAPSPYGEPAVQWTLRVDGRRVAATPAPLTNGGAHDWARRVIGEGVRFEPIMFDGPAEQALREGRAIDWCANPMPAGWRPVRRSGAG